MPKLGLHLLSRARGLLLVTRTCYRFDPRGTRAKREVVIRCTNPFPGTLKFVSEGKASLSQLKFGSSSGSAGSWGGGAGCACRVRSSAIIPAKTSVCWVWTSWRFGVSHARCYRPRARLTAKHIGVGIYKCRPTLNCVILGLSLTFGTYNLYNSINYNNTSILVKPNTTDSLIHRCFDLTTKPRGLKLGTHVPHMF